MEQERRLKVQKTARYTVLQPESGQQAHSLIIALHGYRQLAKYFARSLHRLTELGYAVIAPEGLNRFYVEGYSGRVGATWMTREDRLSDIEDYLGYLNQVWSAEASNFQNMPVHLLGFSQGGATACRWVMHAEIPFQSLVLYASVFPDDFDFDAFNKSWESLRVVMAFGDADEFASEAVIEDRLQWLQSKGINPDMLRFQGGHAVFNPVLERIHTVISGR